ncbi:MAG: DUF4160 domain-containing protein [Bryobacteraceae bacterium]
MPTISKCYGIVIQMFWNDHPRPHFHAVYADEEAKRELNAGSTIQSTISAATLARGMAPASRRTAPQYIRVSPR